MSAFPIHDETTAPAASRPLLEGARKSLGFVPNLFGLLAGSPAALEAYQSLSAIFDKTSLDPTERQVVLITTSVTNGCDYCVAAHSKISELQKLPSDVIEALRNETPLPGKLEALRTFTKALLARQGWADENDIAAFTAAGFDRAQVLDVILGVTFKTLSNDANHVAGTPLDEAFAAHAWSKNEVLA